MSYTHGKKKANRIETIEEITSKGDFISEIGWVKIQLVGADVIKDILSRLPEGESVFWCVIAVAPGISFLDTREKSSIPPC